MAIDNLLLLSRTVGVEPRGVGMPHHVRGELISSSRPRRVTFIMKLYGTMWRFVHSINCQTLYYIKRHDKT